MSLPFSERDFDGMSPSASHPGKTGLLAKLVGLLNGLFATATITTGNASVAVQLDPDLDGKPVVATLNTIDGTLLNVRSASWNGSGLLTITGNANASGDTLVAYHVDGS